MVGPICCLLGVCCPPGGSSREKKIQFLADLMAANEQKDNPLSNATYVIDNFDLVPKGMGVAIVEAYRPIFANPDKKAGA